MMARKKSSKSRSSTGPISIVLILAVLIVVVVVYGGDTIIQMIGDMLGIDTSTLTGEVSGPTGQEQPAVSSEQRASSGAFYTVYFTTPSPDSKDATSGGIEMNLIDLINTAQSSIDVAVFEFNLQGVADALIAAHQRGVNVRIVYDDEHTEEDPQMAQMIRAGIPATPDERSAFMHNKFLVFDRQIVWTGSWNLSTNDTFRNNNNAIAIRSSKLAENYADEFEEMFGGTFGPSKPADTPNPVFTLDGVQIENYFSPEDQTMPNVVNAVNTATQSIHFMAFSFTEDSLGQAMMARAASGVEVAGIFEQRGADTEYSECPPMLGAGLDVRLDGNSYTFHHKVVVIDGKIVVLGSFNFSNNAIESNDENLLIIHDAGLAAQYESEFQRRWVEAAKPVEGNCKKE
jgi:phosphatidylserine/phosphatidylglycerophosphate/cardiolipin synthase-like enzyme